MTAQLLSSDVSQAFTSLRTRLELDSSYDELVQHRHNAIRTFLKNNLPWCETKLLGSVQRRTRIDPLRGLEGFDIDLLVQLGTFSSFSPCGVTALQALSQVYDITSGTSRYSDSFADAPTITVNYADGMVVELVPAYADGTRVQSPPHNAFWIPGNGVWRPADYDFDAAYITQQNQSTSGLLVPLIKMLKAWRRTRLDSFLRSYHLEVMAANILPSAISTIQREGRLLTWPLLVWSFFAWANTRSQVPGTFSEPTDYYMTDLSRAVVEAEMNRCEALARRAIDIDGSSSLEIWRDIFGQPFPGA